MGNLSSNYKIKQIKSIESYINSEDIIKIDAIANVYNKKKRVF